MPDVHVLPHDVSATRADSEVKRRDVRRRVIGLLIRRAREAARWTDKAAAERVGLSLPAYRATELGRRELALPDIEALASSFGAPLAALLDETRAGGPAASSSSAPAMPAELRHHLLGAKLKAARLAAGVALGEAAAHIGAGAPRVKAYELSGRPVPVTELEALAGLYGVPVESLLDDLDGAQRRLCEDAAWAALPAELRAFVSDPANAAHLRLAMQLRALPADELKQLGEAMLKLSQ